jgi:hypothetical protein
MSTEALFSQLKALASSFPVMRYDAPVSEERHRWFGRAYALVSETLGIAAELEFKAAQRHLGSMSYHEAGVKEITGLIYRAIAVLELDLPAGAQGAFIPAGNVFDATSAVSKIFAGASKDLLIVDPYLDEKILTNFAQFANEGTSIRLLGDAASVKGSLAPASNAWAAQFGKKRPLSVRLAAARSLHDRLIMVDGVDVWTVGQSFNALASRAPTSFNKADVETAALKVAAFGDIWNSALAL